MSNRTLILSIALLIAFVFAQTSSQAQKIPTAPKISSTPKIAGGKTYIPVTSDEAVKAYTDPDCEDAKGRIEERKQTKEVQDVIGKVSPYAETAGKHSEEFNKRLDALKPELEGHDLDYEAADLEYIESFEAPAKPLTEGSYVKGDIRNYTVNKMLSKDDRNYAFKVQEGYIKHVEVFWHDGVGEKNEAGGRVFIDAPFEQFMLTPDEAADPELHGPGCMDIDTKGHWSGFTAEAPLYCRGKVILQIVDDNAWGYRFRVDYVESTGQPPQDAIEKPSSQEYQVGQIIKPDDGSELSLKIDPGYIDSVEVRWDDNPGKREALGRVFLNLADEKGVMVPKDADNRFDLPAAEINKKAHWSEFRVQGDAPQYCDGLLIIEILNDIAKIHEVKVNYSDRQSAPE
ncbi:hypothetical protein JXA32_08880 [Candidatus Sumerlaeota bacterium]|nr:hypothetical protein [Candidatus Sumerlaeota bacterium]